MPSPTRYYLTVAQIEELLDILVPMAGGLAGYTQDGRRSSYVFPGGLQHEFVGNENIAELASVWGLDVQMLPPSLSVLDGLAHMQALHACSDALFKAIEGAARDRSGYVHLNASLTSELNAAGVSLSLTDPHDQYWTEVLAIPSVRARLESTWTYPHDAGKRTDAVNAIMSVLGAMGVDIYQLEKTPRVSKQIAPEKRQDPSNPYRITDASMLRESLLKMAEKSLQGGLGAREFIKNVHHQCYARNITLAHQHDLVDAGASSTHPSFMTMQTTRSLMQCYMALSQGNVDGAVQSITHLEGIERPLGRSYLPASTLSSMKEHLSNRAYSLSRVFHDRASLAKTIPSQELDTIRRSYVSAQMAFHDAMSAPEFSLVSAISNLEAMNAWANPGLYHTDPSFRQSMLKKATDRVASLEGNWAGALLNQQSWSSFASQASENHAVWLSNCDVLKASDQMLFARMKEDWAEGYRGDTLLLGPDIGKATVTQKAMLDTHLDSLKAEIAFKTRGLWTAPDVLPTMIEHSREAAEWVPVVELMTSEVPGGHDYQTLFPQLVAYHAAAVKTLEFVRNVMPGIVEKKAALLSTQKPSEEAQIAPADEKPVATTPVAPAVKKPVENKQVAPVTEKPAETKPVAPVATKSAEIKPVAPAAEKPFETKPMAPAAEKPDETKPVAPVAEKPAQTKPVAPAAEKPDETKPVAPSAEKLSETKPSTPVTVAEKQVETKPAPLVAEKLVGIETAAQVAEKPVKASPLPIVMSDDPRTALLQIYEKVTELAFNRDGDLIAADELDWFSAVWDRVVGDLDAMTPEDISAVYPEAMASFGHMMQFKARPALRRWYDESSEKSLQIEGFNELSKRFESMIGSLPSEQSDLLRKVWKAGLRHVIREDGQVPEYVAMDALTRGVAAAETWIQALRKADVATLVSEYGSTFDRYEKAAKAWASFAEASPEAAPAFAVHWDLAIQPTMWFSLAKVQHGVNKLEAFAADPAMRAQIMKFETDAPSTSPWSEQPGDRNLRPTDVQWVVQDAPSLPRNEAEEQERRMSLSM